MEQSEIYQDSNGKYILKWITESMPVPAFSYFNTYEEAKYYEQHNMSNWISSREARDILDVNSSRIRQLCINKELQAQKIKGNWWIKNNSINHYLNKKIKKIKGGE